MAPTYLGITPPISISPPSQRDLDVSQTLIKELKDRQVYEGLEEGRTRELVLGRLNTLVKQFVYRSSLAHGLSDAKAREAGGKIFTFGSYRLGVHGPGADIDTLLVVPKHVERDEFFTLFEEMLKATEGVLEVTVRLFSLSFFLFVLTNYLYPTTVSTRSLRPNYKMYNLGSRYRSLNGKISFTNCTR